MYSHGFRGWLGAGALAVLTAWAVLPGAASAQSTYGDIIPAVVRDAGANKGNEIQPVGCSTCGGGLLAPVAPLGDLGFGGGCASCGGGGGGKYGSCAKKDTCTPCGGEQCYAGRKPCDCCWEPKSYPGFVIKGIYNCICCNDPCYEPTWISLANSAFTLDSPRPVTHVKLGADFGWQWTNPDKGELFFARLNQKGPAAFDSAVVPAGLPNAGGRRGLAHTDYMDAYLYNEAAPTPGFGFFIYMPIRHVDPIADYPSGSGFGDMVIGTKSVILDCELLLATFQFKTFLPTGDAGRGLGTGHVSLEPSLVSALKLTPRSYLQGQLGIRFPIGGDNLFQGSMPYGGLSYNHLLWNCGHDLELIGSLEANIACLTNGQYTDPLTGLPLPARSLGTFANAGPGLRLVICNKVDIGVAASFALTEETTVGDLLRAEFRWRF
jgi:hypothetical protein